MAVQFADKALDEWLVKEIDRLLMQTEFYIDPFQDGYITALRSTQKQLHAFWGSALETKA